MSQDEIMSLEQVATILQVSERTVMREIQAGKIRAFKAGRALRFTKEAIQEYIRNQEVRPEDLEDEEEEVDVKPAKPKKPKNVA